MNATNEAAAVPPVKAKAIPLAEVMDFVRSVQAMRAAQQRYFRTPFGSKDKDRLKRESIDRERRVDAAAADLVNRFNATPPLFGEGGAA